MNTYKEKYAGLMASQFFDESMLDYSILHKHIYFLSQLAKVSNSGVTVFDLFRRQHVFTSYNFADLFGYDLTGIEMDGNRYFDERVHPDDMEILIRNGADALSLFFERKNECLSYKLINEYRVRNLKDEYVRIIEQHQILELDKRGNVWLSLSVWDLSPDQSSFQGVRSQILNCKTGECRSLYDLMPNINRSALSLREVEVLQLIKDGLLSKEISDKLCISVHTVNTHRQNILLKLNANNSMEAVKYASELGLLF
ncbi:LuxR C-terminal-related transcriptional regulator [Bacteroides graminisolvens]